MAAVGGLLFGGAGAVVGAISGSNSKSKTSAINLILCIDNLKEPYVAMNFLPNMTQTGSEEYKKYFDIAQKWYGITSILIEREKKIQKSL